MRVHSGDNGTTVIPLLSKNEGRVKKSHALVRALSRLDSAQAHLGHLAASFRAQCEESKILPSPTNFEAHCNEMSRALYVIMGHLSVGRSVRLDGVDENYFLTLEDFYVNFIELPNGFILPGNNVVESLCNIARTSMREAEIEVVSLRDETFYTVDQSIDLPRIMRILNKFSYLLYLMQLSQTKSITMIKG